jgi:hypothetical protein
MRSASVRLLTTVFCGAAIWGCSDAPVATAPADPAGANTQLLGSPARVNVVTRTTPLASPVSASRTIGLFGGLISLPDAGVIVMVPAFALTTPTLITVTALAGNQVAYEFEPHGTQFRVPLLVTQNLAGTNAYVNGLLPSVLYGGYFTDASLLDQLNGTAIVSELLGTAISQSGTATFAVWHFSGYLLATGESDAGGGEGSQ